MLKKIVNKNLIKNINISKHSTSKVTNSPPVLKLLLIAVIGLGLLSSIHPDIRSTFVKAYINLAQPKPPNSTGSEPKNYDNRTYLPMIDSSQTATNPFIRELANYLGNCGINIREENISESISTQISSENFDIFRKLQLGSMYLLSQSLDAFREEYPQGSIRNILHTPLNSLSFSLNPALGNGARTYIDGNVNAGYSLRSEYGTRELPNSLFTAVSNENFAQVLTSFNEHLSLIKYEAGSFIHTAYLYKALSENLLPEDLRINLPPVLLDEFNRRMRTGDFSPYSPNIDLQRMAANIGMLQTSTKSDYEIVNIKEYFAAKLAYQVLSNTSGDLLRPVIQNMLNIVSGTIDDGQMQQALDLLMGWYLPNTTFDYSFHPNRFYQVMAFDTYLRMSEMRGARNGEPGVFIHAITLSVNNQNQLEAHYPFRTITGIYKTADPTYQVDASKTYYVAITGSQIPGIFIPRNAFPDNPTELEDGTEFSITGIYPDGTYAWQTMRWSYYGLDTPDPGLIQSKTMNKYVSSDDAPVLRELPGPLGDDTLYYAY